MNIGFDLDKIFIDYPPFVPAALIDRLYKKSSDGTLVYRIPSKPEQFIRQLSHLPPFRPPIIANIELVRKWKEKNSNTFYLISSRFSFLKRRTEEIVKKYGFVRIFDGMFFNFNDQQPHIFKNEAVKRLKLDRYIDDDLPLLRFLAKENPNTKFFWLNKNRREKLEKNLFAITSLSEVLS